MTEEKFGLKRAELLKIKDFLISANNQQLLIIFNSFEKEMRKRKLWVGE